MAGEGKGDGVRVEVGRCFSQRDSYGHGEGDDERQWVFLSSSKPSWHGVLGGQCIVKSSVLQMFPIMAVKACLLAQVQK